MHFNSGLHINILMCCVFLGALMYLNEATLLNNIRIRYMKDAIYVSFHFFPCGSFIIGFSMLSTLSQKDLPVPDHPRSNPFKHTTKLVQF